eukprot:c10788_g1_i1.p1 GENE.c10788_g1_i1~~c10788_g1_i1.p1  ORF type:complete len:365 (+),score=62.65 c10788_g1_i1:101-1195(+)
MSLRNVSQVSHIDYPCCSGLQFVDSFSLMFHKVLQQCVNHTQPTTTANKVNLVTCSEMHDVWANEIGPRLRIQEVIQLSQVNTWGYQIAHSIFNHNKDQNIKVNNKQVCQQAYRFWPHIHFTLLCNKTSFERARHFQQSPNISGLVLCRCDVSDFSFFKGLCLKELVLTDICFSQHTCECFETALVAFEHSLTSLTISNCVEESMNLDWLVIATLKLTKLQTFDFHNNHTRNKSHQLSVLLSQMLKLTSLNLGYNELCEGGMKCIVQSLCNLHQLTELNLEDNFIKSTGAECLAVSLAKLTHIRSLNLAWNSMRPKGMFALLPIFQLMPTLTFLDVHDNGLNCQTKKDILLQMQGHVQYLNVGL